MLGGPQGEQIELAPATPWSLPAGTGHRPGASNPDLLVVGAYPPGQERDLRRGDAGELEGLARSDPRGPASPTDPLAGADGPLVALWGPAG